MNKKKTYLLVFLSALLLWLSWPPLSFATPLLLIGLVPLLIALDSIANRSLKKLGKRIFLTTFLTFLIWNTASVYWVFNAIKAYNTSAAALLISLIPYSLGPLLLAFAFWLYYRLKKYVNNKIAYLGLISFYITLEYLQQKWDLAFPWMTLGNGLSGMHQLAQWYDYTGVYGGSFWILISNILAFEAYKKFKGQSGYLKYRIFAIWVLVVSIPIGISLTKYSENRQKGKLINVVIVQPNIDPYKKLNQMPLATQIEILCTLSDSLSHPETKFFIWPETALPLYADEDSIKYYPEIIKLQKFLTNYKDAFIITGIESLKIYPYKKTLSAKFDQQKNQYWDNFNSAMQLDKSGNIQFYHKSKLVPGAEKMPFPKVFSFLDFVFAELGGSVSGWGWQEEPSTFNSRNGINVAPVICYESLWGDWIGQQVKEGANFIAIITNDGWWENTSGKNQHQMYAKLRAIETHRDIVRSANTGISCLINQRGDVKKETIWWTKTGLNVNVNLNNEITFYVKNGDIIANILSTIAITLTLFIFFKMASERISNLK